MKYTKTLAASLALILTLSACGNGQDAQIASEIFPEVEVMDILPGGEYKFRVNGEVSAEKEASLTAELRGDIQNIYVKPGDTVRAGQTLVQLYSASIQDTLSTAGSSLNNARSTLEQTKLSNQKSIEAAQVSLENAQTTLANTLTENEKKRTQAKETLNATKISYGLSSASAESTLESAIRTMNTSLQSAINTTDEIMGVSYLYENLNDTFENNLGALSSQTKEQAERLLEDLIESYEGFEFTYNSAYTLGQQAESSVQKTLDTLNRSTTGSTLSETTLDTYITSVTSELSSIRTALSTLNSAKTALDQTLNTGNGESQTIINAEVAYEATIAALDSAEDTARKAVESAKVALESAKASAQLAEINASSGITNASGSYSQAQINRNKLVITAPFDGVVVDIPVKTGDEVNAGELVATLENTSAFKITAYLSPSQAKKVTVGNDVKIGKKSIDKISAVSPTVDPVTRKHKVEIIHKNPFLHSGQIIPVEFTAVNNSTNSEILIPLIALHVNAEGSFVWTVNEESLTEKQMVVAGEIIGSNIQILEGVNEGDRVIVKGGRMFNKSETQVSVLNDIVTEEIAETATEDEAVTE